MKCIPPWRLQVDEPTSGRRDETIDAATTLKNALLRKIANEQDPLPTGFVQRSRAGYHTAIATELEPNITVTWPLGHMITESDVPDYAELQRHHGHREKMYSFNALLNPMPCINFMQTSCIPSRKHIQMI